MNHWQNWSGLQICHPQQVLHPRSEEELAEILRSTRTGIRVAGAGHSFSALIPTPDTIVSLDQMTGVVDADPDSYQANCWAGTSIKDLGPQLWDVGMSLSVQGDIDTQTLGGVVGTGTHGTGRNFGSISTAVVGFRLMLADGTILDCDAANNSEVFQAGRVALGTLGILTQIRLQCVPAFHLRHTVWTMSHHECLSHCGELLDQHRHFEFWGFPHGNRVVAKTLDVTDAPVKRKAIDLDDIVIWIFAESARWAPPLSRFIQRAAMRVLPTETFTDRAHLVYPTERNVKFNEVEYAIPTRQFEACDRELVDLVRTQKWNIAFPFEYRWVQADDIWLSPFYQRDSAVISVHRYHKQPHREFFDMVERVFCRHGGRPHWGKLHTLNREQLAELYPRWDAFCELRKRLDPEGRFLNGYLSKIFS